MSDTTITVTGTVAEVAQAAVAQMIASGIVNLPKKKRIRVNWESKLAYEYVNRFYSEYPHWFRIEIGAIPNPHDGLLFSKTRRWADVVIRMPDHMKILETKMLVRPDVVGQIINYARLLPATPMFAKYKDLPVQLEVVAALVDEDTRQWVESHGIKVVDYKPSNFEEWYKKVILKEKEGN